MQIAGLRHLFSSYILLQHKPPALLDHCSDRGHCRADSASTTLASTRGVTPLIRIEHLPAHAPPNPALRPPGRGVGAVDIAIQANKHRVVLCHGQHS